MKGAAVKGVDASSRKAVVKGAAATEPELQGGVRPFSSPDKHSTLQRLATCFETDRQEPLPERLLERATGA